MFVMGVASPYWIRAIDGAMNPLAHAMHPHAQLVSSSGSATELHSTSSTQTEAQ
jgi:hypothetical protein